MVVISSAFKAMVALLAEVGSDGAQLRTLRQIAGGGITPVGWALPTDASRRSRLRQLPGEAVELAAQAAVEELGLDLRHEAGEEAGVDLLAQLEPLADLALEHLLQRLTLIGGERLG